MIFGFWQGKIEIFVNKFNFSPGESILGKVFVALKKPTLAKQLKIILAGLKITTQRVTPPKGASTTQTKKEFIYYFEMPLDGEREYLKDEYPFEIKIPETISQSIPTTMGPLGAVMKTMEMISGLAGITSRIEWYLEATLEIPRAFDLKKRVKINI